MADGARHSGSSGQVILLRRDRLETGVRGIWIMPGGKWLHSIEDNPIPAGRYFLVPDETGRWRNWVIERRAHSRCAVDEVRNFDGALLCPPRIDIEVHPGNTMADTEGCVCLGLDTMAGGVTQSRRAIEQARAALGRDGDQPNWHTLQIIDG